VTDHEMVGIIGGRFERKMAPATAAPEVVFNDDDD
jgi:hypothetical protein